MILISFLKDYIPFKEVLANNNSIFSYIKSDFCIFDFHIGIDTANSN